MENPIEIKNVEESRESKGCGYEIAWFGASFVLPLVSPTFYKHGSKKNFVYPLLFFMALMTVVSIIPVVNLRSGISEANQALKEIYAEEGFPVVTIQNGVASIDGPQPFVLLDEQRTLIAMDTTGQITQINTLLYDSGFLLTRTELHVLGTDRQYQRLPLSEFHSLFNQNPIVIDQQWVSDRLTSLFAFFSWIALFVLLAWNVLGWLVYILVLALGIWALASALKLGAEYTQVFIVGLYAFLPALFADYLLSLVEVDFIFLRSLLLLLFWGMGLLFAFREAESGFFAAGRSMRLWRALIGIPMLIVILWSAVASWENEALIVWIFTWVTVVALAFLGYLGLQTGMETKPAE